MSRISITFLATFGLVLGALCVSRQGNAGERESKSSAPAKTSAATAPAAREKPAETASQAEAGHARSLGSRLTSGNAGVGRSLGSRQPAQSAVPTEPLAVLKSGPGHTRLVYRLRATPVTNVSSTLSQLLRQEGELHGSAGTAAKSGPALRVAIAPDMVSNCLLISGPPDAVEEVRLLVEKMDQPPPMVQFEMEMGEAPAGDAKHGGGLTSEGGVRAAEKPRAFRILERPKTMKTIARARVLTLDNQPAFVQMGQRVPRISGVSKNAPAGTAQSVTLDNVGLILGVTPRINVKDGTVVLQVDAEESQLGPENEGIPLLAAGDKVIRSPRIDAVTVQTTVMIPDGKTIILGSIARQGNTEKELVIILTPHIIPPEDGRREKVPGAVNPSGNEEVKLPEGASGGSAHALCFDGRDGSYVSIPNMDMNRLTFATWVKRDAIGKKQCMIMSARHDGWGVYFSEKPEIANALPLGEHQSEMRNHVWFTQLEADGRHSDAEIADRKWHFVTVTLDGNALKFYVDGKPAGNASMGSAFDSGGGNYWLGGAAESGDPGPKFLQGCLRETLVFNRALGPAEIAKLYNLGRGAQPVGKMDGLVAGYHFDEGRGTTVHDFSGHGNDGTLHGGVTWVGREKVPGAVNPSDMPARTKGKTPAPQPSAPRKVNFAIGPKAFAKGDGIVIQEVWSELGTLDKSDTVTVKGTCTLRSQAAATLWFYITTDAALGPQPGTPVSKEIVAGTASFDMKRHIDCQGHLHLGLYDRQSGNCIGTVYFGTEAQMKEISHWNVTARTSSPSRHKVVNGDSLASLAERYLGSASRAMELYEANRDVLTRTDVLPIGAELKIPQTLQGKDLPDLEVAQAKYSAAKAKAEDDIDIRYAIAAANVAKAEYETNKKASEKNPGSVPKERLLELSLKRTEMDLAVELAMLNQRLAGEDAKIAKAELDLTLLRCGPASPHELAAAEAKCNVEIAQARYNAAMAMAGDDIDLRYATADAAGRKAEYEIAADVAQKSPGAVAKERLDELSLKCKEADLAIEKTKRNQRAYVEAARVAKAEREAAERRAAAVQH